ncbi:class II aldolase/adducin family protein [Caballeronia sordidicola]|uniref:class II aldolase/adducin family protein n=1 Tax=Caballeronia sordidicola TaxID=196367 RepID=UPI0035942DA1
MIDLTGKILSPSDYTVDPAGFVIHGPIHEHVEDAHYVMHTHTTAGLSVACMEDGCRTRISAPPSCVTWSLIIRSRALRSATKRSRGC